MLKKVIEPTAANPDDEKFNLAQQKAHDGELQEALTLFQELVRSKPSFPVYQLMVAKTHQDMGDLQQAVLAFRGCMELAPEKETISRCLFRCLWNLGRREEAIEEAKRFLSIKDSIHYRSLLKEIESGSTKWRQTKIYLLNRRS